MDRHRKRKFGGQTASYRIVSEFSTERITLVFDGQTRGEIVANGRLTDTLSLCHFDALPTMLCEYEHMRHKGLASAVFVDIQTTLLA